MMMQIDTKVTSPDFDDAGRGAAVRIVILAGLLFVAFRKNAGEILQVGAEFSEWSHMFAVPVVATAFLYCRLSEADGAPRTPSAWGVLFVFAGIILWCAVVSLGMFGYLQILAFWICGCGVILLSAGRRVFRVCIPLMLMLLTCLPVFERSVDRFTIPIQSRSIRAAASLANAITDDDVRADGRNIVRRRDGNVMVVGAGEQRFGVRMLQSCSLLMLFAAFYRRRSTSQLIVLAMAFVPILLSVNILRIVVWINIASWRGNQIADPVPRNAAAATAIVASLAIFLGLSDLLRSGSRMAGLFYVDDAGGDGDAAGAVDAEPAPSGEARSQ